MGESPRRGRAKGGCRPFLNASYFRECAFQELRRCKSELHTSRVRKRKVSIFEPSRGFDTPLSMPLKNPQFLCRTHPRYS
jgi:hypothetical protein